MSDFLANIVARSFNLVDVIQPRVPTLFEPVPVDHEPVESIASEMAEKGDERLVSTITQQRQLVQPPRTQPRTHTLPNERSQSEIVVAESTEEKEESPGREPAAVQFRREPEFRLTDRVENLGEPEIARARSVSDESAGVEPEKHSKRADSTSPDSFTRLATQVVHPSEVTPQSKSAAPVPDPSRSVVASNPTSYQSIQSMEAPSVSENSVVFGSRLGKASVRAEGHQGRRPTAAAPPTVAPTVKIVIGRVDVRAVVPPVVTSAPPPPRPKPGLSLEDYLKQREEGKR